MRRFIITGAPGSGKTAILRQLELEGYGVVEEAATDIIAAMQVQGVLEPWRDPSFLDAIATLQRDRQIRGSYQPDHVQFHDRCVVCTAALGNLPWTPLLYHSCRRAGTRQKKRNYEKRVFFIRNLGFVTPTEARRISFEEALRFETIHRETYRSYGFDLVWIEPASVMERVNVIKATVRQAT